MENMEGMKLDNSASFEEVITEVPVEATDTKKRGRKATLKVVNTDAPEGDNIVSCLRNTRVIVRYLKRQQGIWGDNVKHVLAGGMAENAKRTLVVPTLSSGMYVNVLTDNEKKFLEKYMGLEPNTMSIYKKQDNFWDSNNDEGVNKVTLKKEDNYLDLSNPEDYIKYKILLANKNLIAPSLRDYNEMPLPSYQFVIIEDDEEVNVAKNQMSSIMKAYKEYGKIEEDKDKLQLIIEIITGQAVANSTKLTVLQTKINELIQENAARFIKVLEDEYLNTKVLIKQAVLAGVIVKKGNYFYVRNGMNTIPMCGDNQEPTFTNAAIYLNSPAHQDVYLAIQAKVQ